MVYGPVLSLRCSSSHETTDLEHTLSMATNPFVPLWQCLKVVHCGVLGNENCVSLLAQGGLLGLISELVL